MNYRRSDNIGLFKSKTQKEIEELEKLKKLQEDLMITKGIPVPAPSPPEAISFDDAIKDAKKPPELSNAELVESIISQTLELVKRIKKDAKHSKPKVS